MQTMARITAAFGLAAALSVAAANPGHAGVLPSTTAALKGATPSHTTEVHWRGGWGPGAFFAGAALGAATLGAFGPWGYGGGYYPAYGGYYPAYTPAYSYYAPAPYYYPRRYWRPRYVYARPHWRTRYVYARPQLRARYVYTRPHWRPRYVRHW